MVPVPVQSKRFVIFSLLITSLVVWTIVVVVFSIGSASKKNYFFNVHSDERIVSFKPGHDDNDDHDHDDSSASSSPSLSTIYEHWKNYQTLLTKLRDGRDEMEHKMKQDYGNRYFYHIFYDQIKNEEEGVDNKSSSLSSRGRSVFVAVSEESYQRWLEILQRKILTVQEQMHVHFEFTENPKRDKQHQQRQRKKDILPRFLDRFVYAAGGNSISAGHGNLDREAHVNVAYEWLHETIFQNVFSINFERRNYGMSAMKSVPECSFCISSIYGTDVDLLSRDFDVTDHRQWDWMTTLWNLRASIVPPISSSSVPSSSPFKDKHRENQRHQRRRRSPPALLAMNLAKPERSKLFIELERVQSSLLSSSSPPPPPLLHMNATALKQVFDDIPDTTEYFIKRKEHPTEQRAATMNGEAQQNEEELPRLLMYLKCNGNMIESGEPNCGKNKFNTSICPKRWWMVSWHPGFKRLAISGTLFALFMVDSLEDAIINLQQQYDDDRTGTGGSASRNDTTQSSTTVSLEWIRRKLQQLQGHDDGSDENNHEKDFFAEGTTSGSPVTSYLRKNFLTQRIFGPFSNDDNDSRGGDSGDFLGIPLEAWYTRPSICRTAKLPSQMRYKGILTGKTHDEVCYGQSSSSVTSQSPSVSSSTSSDDYDTNKVYETIDYENPCFYREGIPRDQYNKKVVENDPNFIDRYGCGNIDTTRTTTRTSIEKNISIKDPSCRHHRSMVLTYDERGRQSDRSESVGIDYSDSFSMLATTNVGHDDADNKPINDDDDGNGGWYSVTLPSTAEMEEYGDWFPASSISSFQKNSSNNSGHDPVLGIVLLCPVRCEKYNRGGCVGNEILLPAEQGLLDFKVNNIPAASETFLDACLILRRNDDDDGEKIEQQQDNTTKTKATKESKQRYRFPPKYDLNHLRRHESASSSSSSWPSVETDWSYTIQIRINEQRVGQLKQDSSYQRPKALYKNRHPFSIVLWSSFILL